ncbi:hypothetical protein NVIE_004650 [Nitrososphaera viennensis EN76]|uniref:Uncharacterized protein n=2 Tax=Nitrososphaera viennensis TaxID=1034015 RepID=A0A060HH32_9ARCH|nr:hypothetical protein NVIE_004650 [Nitrososphaera viennensis EN76]
MNELGINSGDVVKVTGVRSTGAVCLPLEPGYRHPNDSEITYLSKSDILPQIRISDVVALNTNNTGAILVEVEKVQSSHAQKVSFASLDSRFNAGNLDKGELLGMVVCKGDRINLQDYHQVIVTDIYAADFSLIDDSTEIEFVDNKMPGNNLVMFVPQLNRLSKVIPVAKQANVSLVNITIPSIEIYEEGAARFYFYLKGNYASYRQFHHAHVSLAVQVHDNVGNPYRVFVHGGGGGLSSTGDFNYDYSCLFAPAVVPDATELTITIKEILFQAPFVPPPSISGRPEMRPMYSPGNKLPAILVLTGPWEFKIPFDGRR